MFAQVRPTAQRTQQSPGEGFQGAPEAPVALERDALNVLTLEDTVCVSLQSFHPSATEFSKTTTLHGTLFTGNSKSFEQNVRSINEYSATTLPRA